MASECRMVLAYAIGERKLTMAKDIVARTAKRLASMPLFVTDGLKFYARALLEQYGFWKTYHATGKRGRPRRDRLTPDNKLRYAQIIKIRQGGRMKEVIKKNVFGKDIDVELISTSLIERLNLTLRQDNNRISRKTIGFSKKIQGLKEQMNLYFVNYNFCRGHRSLKQPDCEGKMVTCSPAKYFGLTNRNLDLKELLATPYYKMSTNYLITTPIRFGRQNPDRFCPLPHGI